MKKNGFTLIELLVVMILIGILATVGLGSYFTALTKGRDAKRKQDLEQIQRALELFYNDNGRYPTFGEFPDPGVTWSTGETIYIKLLPTDPKSPTYTYVYSPQGGPPPTGYLLYARLENPEDACFDIGTSCRTGGFAGADCTTEGDSCNYAVSSANVLLL